jgi:hypothetical protein
MPGREGDHDRIGVARVVSLTSSGIEFEPLNGGLPVVDVGTDGEFDGTDVLDPAPVEFKGKVFLYYSAIGGGPDSVGLAISEDGASFQKFGKLMEGRAPDIVLLGDSLFMVYQRADEAGNYRVHLARSEDGLSFQDVQKEPVLRPSPGTWDSLSIATVRLSKEGDVIYALYGGSSYLADEPDFFGLARTRDMIEWEFHPGNPIFGCGPKGAPDGGAIWFPALHETQGSFVMLYEGSRGKYAWDVSSAICLASIPKAD